MITGDDEDVSTTDEYILIVVLNACSKLFEAIMLVRVDCNTCKLYVVTDVDEVTTDELVVVTFEDIEDVFTGAVGATDGAAVVVTFVTCNKFASTVWRV